MGKYAFLFFSFLISISLACCTNEKDGKASGAVPQQNNNQGETALSEEEAERYEDCNEPFFSSVQKIQDTSSLKIKIKNGSVHSWTGFVNDELMSRNVRWGVKDLDNDSVPELLVFNYTGGAHCCNELYIFSREPGVFMQQARLFSGFSCIEQSGALIRFSFNEPLGYFFACYACGFTDSTGAFRSIREIALRYENRRFKALPFDPDTEKQLYLNLSVLARHEYEEMEEGLMDSGWRKEFAMNFAAWHYTHGKNWRSTKALFDKFYTFKDAANVWSAFRKALSELEKQNDI